MRIGKVKTTGVLFPDSTEATTASDGFVPVAIFELVNPVGGTHYHTATITLAQLRTLVATANTTDSSSSVQVVATTEDGHSHQVVISFDPFSGDLSVVDIADNLTDLHQAFLIGGGEGNEYILPVATNLTIGGVKQGEHIVIAADGTISAVLPPLPIPATDLDLGLVRIGQGIEVTAEGVISIPTNLGNRISAVQTPMYLRNDGQLGLNFGTNLSVNQLGQLIATAPKGDKGIDGTPGERGIPGTKVAIVSRASAVSTVWDDVVFATHAEPAHINDSSEKSLSKELRFNENITALDGVSQFLDNSPRFGYTSMVYPATIPTNRTIFTEVGDFSIHAWIYVKDTYPVSRGALVDTEFGPRYEVFGGASPNGAFIISQQGENTNNWNIGLQPDGKISFSRHHTVIASSSTSAPLNGWSVIDVCKVGNAVKVYLNGVGGAAGDGANLSLVAALGTCRLNFKTRSHTDNAQLQSLNHIYTNPEEAIPLNTHVEAMGTGFSGYIDDVLIVKGTALYTADFEVVPSPFATDVFEITRLPSRDTIAFSGANVTFEDDPTNDQVIIHFADNAGVGAGGATNIGPQGVKGDKGDKGEAGLNGLISLAETPLVIDAATGTVRLDREDFISTFISPGRGLSQMPDGRLRVDPAILVDLMYQLPQAQPQTLGGIKLGDGLLFDSVTGRTNVIAREVNIAEHTTTGNGLEVLDGKLQFVGIVGGNGGGITPETMQLEIDTRIAADVAINTALDIVEVAVTNLDFTVGTLVPKVAALITTDTNLQTQITTLSDQLALVEAGNTYTLPVASETVLGGVKVDGTTITTDANGVISSVAGAPLVPATSTVLGGVKVDGTTITIDGTGTITSIGGGGALTPATDTTLGGVMVDGTTITVDANGVISASGGGGGGGTPTGTSIMDSILFEFNGTPAPTTGTSKWFSPLDMVARQFYVSIDEAPTSSILVRLNKNGVEVATVELAAGESISSVAEFEESSAAHLDHFTVDIVTGDSGRNIRAYMLITHNLENAVNVAMPLATVDTVGAVQPGYGLQIDASGLLTINPSLIGLGSGGGGGTSANTSVLDAILFEFYGTPSPTVGTARWYPPVNLDARQFYVSIDEAPTSPIIISLYKNDDVVVASVTIEAYANISNVALFQEGAVALTDYFTVDIDAGTTGANIRAYLMVAHNTAYLADVIMPIADSAQVGAVKPGYGLQIDASGVLSVDPSVIGGGSVGGIESFSVLDSILFEFNGTATPTVGTSKWYPPRDATIRQFYVSVDEAPTSPVVVRLNKNGDEIASVIVDIGESVSVLATFNEIAVALTDYFTVDIVSGESGTNVRAYMLTAQNINTLAPVTMPIAADGVLGAVKPGYGLSVNAEGLLTVTGSLVGGGATGDTTTVLTQASFTNGEKIYTIGIGGDFGTFAEAVAFINTLRIQGYGTVFFQFLETGEVYIENPITLNNPFLSTPIVFMAAPFNGEPFGFGSGLPNHVITEVTVTSIITSEFTATIKISNPADLIVGSSLNVSMSDADAAGSPAMAALKGACVITGIIDAETIEVSGMTTPEMNGMGSISTVTALDVNATSPRNFLTGAAFTIANTNLAGIEAPSPGGFYQLGFTCDLILSNSSMALNNDVSFYGSTGSWIIIANNSVITGYSVFLGLTTDSFKLSNSSFILDGVLSIGGIPTVVLNDSVLTSEMHFAAGSATGVFYLSNGSIVTSSNLVFAGTPTTLTLAAGGNVFESGGVGSLGT